MNEYNQFMDWPTPSSELERRSRENLERIWRETEARRQRLIEKYETRAKVNRCLIVLCTLNRLTDLAD